MLYLASCILHVVCCMQPDRKRLPRSLNIGQVKAVCNQCFKLAAPKQRLFLANRSVCLQACAAPVGVHAKQSVTAFA